MLFHMVFSRFMLQETVNCWLSYVTAQPVSFDINILIIFTLQYFGLLSLWQFIRSAAYTTQQEEYERVEEPLANEAECLVMQNQVC